MLAQSQLFEGIKFKCAVCGMRFIRNQTLKNHLDRHFEHGAALKKINRRKGVQTTAPGQGPAHSNAVEAATSAGFGCTAGGIMASSRQPFQSFIEFAKPVQAKQAQDGQEQGQQSLLDRNAEDLVPYDGAKSHEPLYNYCFLCKEQLEVAYDEADEGWYFLDAKMIKLNQD